MATRETRALSASGETDEAAPETGRLARLNKRARRDASDTALAPAASPTAAATPVTAAAAAPDGEGTEGTSDGESSSEIVSMQVDVDLSDRGLALFPRAVLTSSFLHFLDLSNNSIPSLPDEIMSLTHLAHLNLSQNLLDTLPKLFHNLKSLVRLDLGRNQFQAIPDQLSKCHALQVWGKHAHTPPLCWKRKKRHPPTASPWLPQHQTRKKIQSRLAAGHALKTRSPTSHRRITLQALRHHTTQHHVGTTTHGSECHLATTRFKKHVFTTTSHSSFPPFARCFISVVT
eukprot:m.14405 g.14405  ORF g.14405 m.14405 type:complete len:288 (+) comp4792_c0_seq2:848-1711(+)